MLQRLYVVRHGQTQWNQEFRLQGRLDSGLTDTGKRQADENGRLLRRAGVKELLASPLGRTTETAHIINSHVQGQLNFSDALVERDCGEWSGLTIDDVRAQHPLQWQARQRDEWHHRPPGGENLPDVLTRVGPLLEALRGGEAEQVAIISHGVVGKAILAHYLGLDAASGADLRQPNDVVYVCDFAANPAPGVEVQCEHYRRGEGPLGGLVRGPIAMQRGLNQ